MYILKVLEFCPEIFAACSDYNSLTMSMLVPFCHPALVLNSNKVMLYVDNNNATKFIMVRVLINPGSMLKTLVSFEKAELLLWPQCRILALTTF